MPLRYLQGFSTISSQPCGGYSWKANECHLKPTGELAKSTNSAFTSGEVSTPRNFSSGSVVATPPKTGDSNGTGVYAATSGTAVTALLQHLRYSRALLCYGRITALLAPSYTCRYMPDLQQSAAMGLS